MIPALRRKRQADLCEFEDSQGYTENPYLKKRNNKKELERKKKTRIVTVTPNAVITCLHAVCFHDLHRLSFSLVMLNYCF